MNRPTLDVQKSSDGKVRRLVLMTTSNRERDQALVVPGAVAAKDRNRATFPVDPSLVDELIRLYGRLELTAEADHWYKEWKVRCRDAIRVRLVEKPPSVDVPWFGRLYPYQQVGSAWMRTVKRGILGDDPGLGKTIQSLTAAADARSLLIVTPNIVKEHWRDILRNWVGREAAVATGSQVQRQRVVGHALVAYAPLVINPEMLRGGGTAKDPYRALYRRKWDAVILDEAHVFQGRQSKQSNGAEKLQTDRLLLLTGTPIWGKPESLWHLLHLLDPARFSSFWAWVDEYCTTIVTEYGLEIVGFRLDKQAKLQSVLAEFILRRDKETVLPDLPPKVVQRVPYQLTDWQYRQLSTMRRRLMMVGDDGTPAVRYETALQAVQQMRMLCNAPVLVDPSSLSQPSPKTQAITELLELLVEDEQRKVVIFTWHVAYAEHLQQQLVSRRYGVQLATGHHTDRARQAAIERFRTDPTQQLLVATIGAVGIGIDLVEASAAIFAEGDYVPARTIQAEDRLHRIGQTVVTTIYRLAGENSVEEDIWDVVDRRQDLADEVLSFQAVIERMRERAG